MREKIGECLIQAALITDDDLRAALTEHERTGERIGAVLVRLNLAAEKQIAEALAYQLGFPFIDLGEQPPDPLAIRAIPKDIAARRECVGVRLEANTLTVAMAEPLVFSLVQDLEALTGFHIEQAVATRGDIMSAIETGYPPEAPAPLNRPPSEPTVRRDPLPAADLAEVILRRAIDGAATDVHVEPTERGVIIRHRVDGMLREVHQLPEFVRDGLAAQLKAKAAMDPAETRLPQSGRLRAKGSGGQDVDFRVFSLRTLFGEKIVLRRLDPRRRVPALADLGMSYLALETTRSFLRHQHGLILVAGPHGSGRKTTLAAAIQAMRAETTNILTIEDPIEYQIAGVNQTQVDEAINLTFAGAMRSALRQDPDVILLGELRDGETAALAAEAGRTGTLVCSSLHADAAAPAAVRLGELGVEPHAIGSALLGVIAQRLVRRLCASCRQEGTPSRATLTALNIADPEDAPFVFYKAVGCDQCNYTGFRGRTGIFEVMRVDDAIRRLILARAPADQIREAAMLGGMISLAEDGLSKVSSGVTTAEELLRVVADIRDMRPLCPACGAAVAGDFLACPRCGERLGATCPHCQRALQPEWTFCPYCAHGATESRRVSPRPGAEGPRMFPGDNVTEFKK